MLNQTVRVTLKNAVIEGVVTKVSGQNNDILYVQSGNDTYKIYVNVNNVEIIDTLENLISDMAESLVNAKYEDVEEMEEDWRYPIREYAITNNLEYFGDDSGCGVDTGKYSIFISLENGKYTCESYHKGRAKKIKSLDFENRYIEANNIKDPSANFKEYKKLQSVLNYINKYIN